MRLKTIALRLSLVIALLAFNAPVWPDEAKAAAPTCWSLLSSKYGPGLLRSVEEADPCAKMPGFEQKESFKLIGLDLCSAPDGVEIQAQADLACRSKAHGGFLKGMEMSGKLQASMTVDIGACRITDSHVSVSGPVGALLTSVGDIQGLARKFAQRKVSEICSPH